MAAALEAAKKARQGAGPSAVGRSPIELVNESLTEATTPTPIQVTELELGGKGTLRALAINWALNNVIAPRISPNRAHNKAVQETQRQVDHRKVLIIDRQRAADDYYASGLHTPGPETEAWAVHSVGNAIPIWQRIGMMSKGGKAANFAHTNRYRTALERVKGNPAAQEGLDMVHAGAVDPAQIEAMAQAVLTKGNAGPEAPTIMGMELIALGTREGVLAGVEKGLSERLAREEACGEMVALLENEVAKSMSEKEANAMGVFPDALLANERQAKQEFEAREAIRAFQQTLAHGQITRQSLQDLQEALAKYHGGRVFTASVAPEVATAYKVICAAAKVGSLPGEKFNRSMRILSAKKDDLRQAAEKLSDVLVGRLDFHLDKEQITGDDLLPADTIAILNETIGLIPMSEVITRRQSLANERREKLHKAHQFVVELLPSTSTANDGRLDAQATEVKQLQEGNPQAIGRVTLLRLIGKLESSDAQERRWAALILQKYATAGNFSDLAAGLNCGLSALHDTAVAPVLKPPKDMPNLHLEGSQVVASGTRAFAMALALTKPDTVQQVLAPVEGVGIKGYGVNGVVRCGTTGYRARLRKALEQEFSPSETENTRQSMCATVPNIVLPVTADAGKGLPQDEVLNSLASCHIPATREVKRKWLGVLLDYAERVGQVPADRNENMIINALLGASALEQDVVGRALGEEDTVFVAQIGSALRTLIASAGPVKAVADKEPAAEETAEEGARFTKKDVIGAASGLMEAMLGATQSAKVAMALVMPLLDRQQAMAGGTDDNMAVLLNPQVMALFQIAAGKIFGSNDEAVKAAWEKRMVGVVETLRPWIMSHAVPMVGQWLTSDAVNGEATVLGCMAKWLRTIRRDDNPIGCGVIEIGLDDTVPDRGQATDDKVEAAKKAAVYESSQELKRRLGKLGTPLPAYQPTVYASGADKVGLNNRESPSAQEIAIKMAHQLLTRTFRVRRDMDAIASMVATNAVRNPSALRLLTAKALDTMSITERRVGAEAAGEANALQDLSESLAKGETQTRQLFAVLESVVTFIGEQAGLTMELNIPPTVIMGKEGLDKITMVVIDNQGSAGNASKAQKVVQELELSDLMVQELFKKTGVKERAAQEAMRLYAQRVSRD